jgi:hypothetical protein
VIGNAIEPGVEAVRSANFATASAATSMIGTEELR